MKKRKKHDSHLPAPEIVIERALRSDEFVPPKPKPRKSRRKFWIAGLVSLLILTAGAYGLFHFRRAALSDADEKETADETQTAPTVLPGALDTANGIPPETTAIPAPMQPSRARAGTIRFIADTPEYAREYLRQTAKRVRTTSPFAAMAGVDNSAWLTIETLPYVMTDINAGPLETALEAEGFTTDEDAKRILVTPGATTDVVFTLAPLTANLVVNCNIAKAQIHIQTEDQESDPIISATEKNRAVIQVPSLRPLNLTISATDHIEQDTTIKPLNPSQTLRREFTLRPIPVKTERVPVTVPPGSRPGAIMTVNLGDGVDMDFVWIPPGEFTMGSPENERGRYVDEGPQHPVEISQGFWLGKYEVTQKQWEHVMGTNPSNFQVANNPVEQVSWQDCQDFIEKTTAKAKNIYGHAMAFGLPSEAEWEYACRAGTTSPLNNGRRLMSIAGLCPNLDEIAWFHANSEGKTHPVGGKQPNAWDLYDMHGNVWEWCRDGKRIYSEVRQTDPEGTSNPRLTRGGSFGDYANFCRSALRYAILPTDRTMFLGLRLMIR